MKKKSSACSMRILLVEDQSSDIAGPYFLTNHLGCSVTLAFDGEQALDESNKHHFDLIILDWNMPNLTGEEFLKTLEYRANVQNRSKKKMNIVLHSGQEIDLDQFQGKQGFQVLDLWKKPMTPSEMLKKIKSVRERWEHT